MRPAPLAVIFFTVFVDLIGFGLVLPLLPNYSRSFGATAFMAGCIMASYSLMQFLFAPAWGALSDRIGRRPILLVSTAVASLSYATFAIGSTLSGNTALLVIVLSRMIAGICGANITVAQAYIADITPPEDRSRRMGLIGMAFGLGFIVGPALAVGAQVATEWAGGGSAAVASAPGWLASALCAANFLSAFLRLPESWKAGTANARRSPRWKQFTETVARPHIGFLTLTFFLATFGFTCFESTLGLLIQGNFSLGDATAARTNSLLFCYAGLLGALVQAGPIGRLLKSHGEARLIAGSLILFGLSLLPIPFIRGTAPLTGSTLIQSSGLPWFALFITVGGLAIGSGITRPPLFGLISRLTPAHEQGATLGIVQSAGALARVFGPPTAGFLFDQHPSRPYLVCGVLAILTGMVAWQQLVRKSLPEPTPTHAPSRTIP
jgi:DHA1 family tetracycline resistance protein-like MFS transporter